MKPISFLSLLFAAFLAAAALAGCSHSTAPQAPNTTIDSNTVVRLYPLTGEAAQMDIADSHFDTVFWYPASLDSVKLTGSKKETVRTGLSGSYFFDSLPAGNYSISVSKSGFAAASLRVNVPADTSSANEIHLFPVSWLQAMIDDVHPDPDPSQGLDVRIILTSTDPSQPPIGSVYLFMDTTNAIDPVVASSYDPPYIYEVGNQRSDTIYEKILPQLVPYPAGTKVFCTAYASPYAQQFTYASRDSNDKPIYPFFGAHPGNMVSFQIP
ncbi:MAG TPA: carboxypeptidase-like regulatory domain-containing protein [Candidatus Kapabacteria bacterium]|nr:carboxypeptidase-like regulatory domain-containing protein [Candidatus Kapabacteria bacterium]